MSTPMRRTRSPCCAPAATGHAAAKRDEFAPSHYSITFSGGMISYGTEVTDLYQRAAGYIDRVLRGAKPGDLPVQLPIKYELVINLKTAKALAH
jgi:putative ABC transport system substrate-binding protein